MSSPLPHTFEIKYFIKFVQNFYNLKKKFAYHEKDWFTSLKSNVECLSRHSFSHNETEHMQARFTKKFTNSKIEMKIYKLYNPSTNAKNSVPNPRQPFPKIHSPISLSFQHPVLTTQGKSLDNARCTHTHTHTHSHILTVQVSQEALAWYRLLLVGLETRCKTKAV